MANVQTFLKTVFGLDHGGFNLIIYLGIIVLFIIGVIRCILPVVRNRGVLRRAIRSIRSNGDSKYNWQEDRFLGKGSLFAHWSEYLSNLFFAEGVYHNASNVEDFINEETVIYGPGRTAFSDALPGLMTSLGFLGTLVGLWQGLSGFNMTDSAAVQNSIVTLVPGMRTAFLTSIFGVIGSVLFTLITRAVHGSTEHTLTDFYGAMSRYAGVRSVDPMTQIAIYQQEQTALIQTMAKDINGAFTENIAEAVHSAIEPLNQSFHNFVTINTKDQMRFIDAVSQRFVERLDQSLSGQLRAFGDVLSETSRLQQENCVIVRASLAGTKEAVAELEDMRGMVTDMVSRLSAYVRQLDDFRQKTEEAYQRVASTIQQLDQVSRQQSNYLKAVSNMQADISKSADGMTAAMSSFARKFNDESAGATTALQKAATDLRTSAAHIENVHIQANKTLEAELSNTLDAYRDYVNQFTQRVDYLASNISGSLEQMPDAVNETSNRFLDQMDRLTDTLAQAEQELNAAIDRLYRN